MTKIKNFEKFCETMIPDNTLKQMREISNIMGDIDIGKRVPDSSFANALGDTSKDVTQTHVQTYSEYMAEPFDDNQNRIPWDKRKNKKK